MRCSTTQQKQVGSPEIVFFELHRFLHFVDNFTLSTPGTPGYDKLSKIRPIITALSDRFSSIYTPGRDISIDEGMIPFKGRSSLKQYMLKKPIRREFKVWMRAEAVNGYDSGFGGDRGQSKTVTHDSNLTVSVWQDNCPVVVIASNSDPAVSTSVTRKNKDGTSQTVSCPSAVALYNKYMGGVDRNDQLRGYYHVRTKGRKYYKYLFWFLFDVACTNTYILAKHYSNLTVCGMKAFTRTLATELIGSYANRKRRGRPALLTFKRFRPNHFPRKGGSNQGYRCHYCSLKKVRRNTVWQCKDCQVFLCHTGKADDCFLLYHQQHCLYEE